MNFEYGKLYDVNSPDITVSNVNLQEVIAIILEYEYYAARRKDKPSPFMTWIINNPMSTMVKIVSSAVGTDETQTGVVQRISKAFHDIAGVDMLPITKQQIGNIVYKNSIKLGKYQVGLFKDFDMKGKFGDANSCFYSTKQTAFQIMSLYDTLSVRVWKNERPAGRCLGGITGNNDSLTSIPEGALVLFNGYGLPTVGMVHLVSNLLGLPYMSCNLSVNGETSGNVWINHNDPNLGGNGTHASKNGRGYALFNGADKVPNDPRPGVSFNWQAEYCGFCEDMYLPNNNGCPRCYSNPCEGCGKKDCAKSSIYLSGRTFSNDDSRNRYVPICFVCELRNMSQCRRCGKCYIATLNKKCCDINLRK